MRSKSGPPSSRIAPAQPALATIGMPCWAKIKIRRGVVEVLVGVDEIADFGAAGELQGLFDLVDTADIGVDEDGAAVARL